MTFAVVWSARAHRDLQERVPPTVVAAVVSFVTGPLAENPRRVGKPLRGPLTGLWSARRGEYRVVYQIDDDRITIEIVRVAHRRDVYRR